MCGVAESGGAMSDCLFIESQIYLRRIYQTRREYCGKTMALLNEMGSTQSREYLSNFKPSTP